jgi:hypothetical protein
MNVVWTPLKHDGLLHSPEAGITRRNLSILCGVLRFAARRRRRCKSFIPPAADVASSCLALETIPLETEWY